MFYEIRHLAVSSFQALILIIRLIGDLATAWYMQIRDLLTARKKSIKGDVVVITGGAGGIGSNLARQLARCGAKIVLVDLNKEAVATRAKILKEQGWPVWWFDCDCTDENALTQLADKIYDHPDLGRVDILINCAGLLIPKSVLSLTAADIRKSFDVNVTSIFLAIKAFLPSMLKRNKGHVVAISSIAGYFGQSYASSYSAAKFAIRGLMESVTWEIHDAKRPGVKTTTIFPYFTQTNLLDSCSPSSRFFDNLPVDYTVSHIVDYILYEYTEAFIPAFTSFCALFLKATSVGYVRAVWRDFFNVVYFARNQPPPLISRNLAPSPKIAQIAAYENSPNGQVGFDDYDGDESSAKANGSTPSSPLDFDDSRDHSQLTEPEF